MKHRLLLYLFAAVTFIAVVQVVGVPGVSAQSPENACVWELLEDFENISDWSDNITQEDDYKEEGTYSGKLYADGPYSYDTYATKTAAVDFTNIDELRFWYRVRNHWQVGGTVTATLEIDGNSNFSSPTTIATITVNTGTIVENTELVDVTSYSGNYYIRFHLNITGNEMGSFWFDNLQMYHNPLPVITSISADSSLIDRDIDRAGSGADDTVRITVQAQDTVVDDIDNSSGIAYITIFNPSETKVVDNLDISASFSHMNDNTGSWYCDFNPANDAVLGAYYVETWVFDEAGGSDNTLPGISVFTVDDLDNITINIDNTSSEPLQNVTVSGTISRSYGGSISIIDNIWLTDANAGAMTPSTTDNTYTKTYQVSGRGPVGVTVEACWGVLDGENSASYTVVNVGPTLQSITADTNLIDRKVDYGGSGADDTVRIWVQARDNNGTADFNSVSIWIRDGNDTTLIDNLDITANYVDIDSLTRKWYYDFNPSDALPDENLGWFDARAEVVDNDDVWVLENWAGQGSQLFVVDDILQVSISLDNNTPAPEQSITVSGEASRVYGTATLDNAEVVDSAEGTLSASVTDVVGQPDSYAETYQVNSPGGTSVSVYVWILDDMLDGISATLGYTVRLQAPTLLSPDNSSATTDDTPTLIWKNVAGAEGYIVQCGTLENFDDAFEISTTESFVTLPELAEGRYYWRVRATTSSENVENSAWASRNFWVDKTDPSISSFLINAGASETTSSLVALNLFASDSGSGVYQMCFRNEGGSWSEWESYSTSKSWTLNSGDGSKTVYAKVRDKALNESSISSDGITKTTYVPPGGGGNPPADTTPPTLAVLEPTTSEVIENVTVRVSASDPSGIDSGSILMTLDGDTVQHAYSGGEITCSFVRLGAGGHLVVVKVSDASSNHNQVTVNISFTVVAPVENVENVENVTPTPTFTFQLPETPPEVENGCTQIMLWITNPTPQTIVKHCELRFNDHVKSFDIEVAAGENALVTMMIDVAGLKGTYDVELYDADTNTMLDEGEITLLAAAEQIEAPHVAVTSPSPSPPIVVIGVVGVAVGLGVLRIAGRLPKIKIPKFGFKLPKVKITKPSMPSIRLPSLPRLPNIKHKPKLEKRLSPEEGWLNRILERAREKELERAREEELEFAEKSPVVQDIYHLLEPAARELATEKKVGHLNHAVKPYKKRRR